MTRGNRRRSEERYRASEKITEDGIIKHRVFVFVEDNSQENKPDKILAVDDTGERLFSYDVDNRGQPDSYERQYTDAREDAPAAVAYAAFQRFCREVCGLKGVNDEVIFAESGPSGSLSEYVGLRLDAADWTLVTFLEFDYRYETAYLERPMRFKNFRRSCTEGIPEPYATRVLYENYRERIHKDAYTEEELDRMEKYVFSHLDAVYRRRRRCLDAIRRVSAACAAVYRGDRARFCRIMEGIVADFSKRRSKKKRWLQSELLVSVADKIFGEGEIDLVRFAEEEKLPPPERKIYSIFAPLSPEALETVTEIIEAYEKGNILY